MKLLARALLLVGVICGAAGAGLAPAQTVDYPTKPIRLINPNPAGSGSDIIAREFAAELARQLKQSIYVENRAGAGSTIGSETGAKSAPDGYTLTQTSSPLFAVVPLVYAKLNFDPVKDFRSIIVTTSFNNVLVVHPDVPAKSVKELIEAAKNAPGKLTYASSGNGTTTHLSGEMFKQMAGIDLAHIPYRGGAPAITDLLGGQVSMMFSPVSSVLQYIKAGTLRALAVTSHGRDPALPDIPTMQEAGVPDYEAGGWFSLSAPAATPQAVVDKLSQAAAASLKSPAFIKKMRENGFEVVGGTPKQMDEMMQAEIQRWGPLVKASGLRID